MTSARKVFRILFPFRENHTGSSLGFRGNLDHGPLRTKRESGLYTFHTRVSLSEFPAVGIRQFFLKNDIVGSIAIYLTSFCKGGCESVAGEELLPPELSHRFRR